MSVAHSTIAEPTLIPKHLSNEFEPFLCVDKLSEFATQHRDSFMNATPFNHVIIDQFFDYNILSTLCTRFPHEETSDEQHFRNGYAGSEKRQISPDSCDDRVKYIFYQLNSKVFLEFLEKLSGIEGLIGDPYFEGGGLHETSRGGRLGVHADFILHRRLNLRRRLNVIVYLNEEWHATYGGELELWSKDMKRVEKTVQPILNRCVIFATDEHSYHGHPNPVNAPEGVVRKSLATYYYTASQSIIDEIPSFGTNFVSRSEDSLSVKIQTAKIGLVNKVRDYIPPALARRFLSGYRD